MKAFYYFVIVVGALLLVTLLLGTAGVFDRPTLPTTTVTPPSGSVIFWEDSLLVGPISRQTGSRITHAAILLDGWVYEAVPPRVHKMLLADYIEHLRIKSRRQPKFKWFIMQPRDPVFVWQVEVMTSYAESQLGRPYSVRGWWRGYQVRGILLALVANILAKGKIIESAGVHESPVSLYEKLEPTYD